MTSGVIDRYINKVVQRSSFDIGARLSNFLATGNLSSPTGLDLQQASGFTIIAEKLNWYRYISHFRCIHRGAFFAELKTTTVRKLLPEAWGMSYSFSNEHSANGYLEASYAPSIHLMVPPVACSTTYLDRVESSHANSTLEAFLAFYPR